MKQYKLSGWPDLAPPFHGSRYRRMLSDMSHRYVTVAHLMAAANSSRQEVRLFLEMLEDRGLLSARETEPDSILDSLSDWFRRTVTGDLAQH